MAPSYQAKYIFVFVMARKDIGVSVLCAHLRRRPRRRRRRRRKRRRYQKNSFVCFIFILDNDIHIFRLSIRLFVIKFDNNLHI